MKSTAFFFVLFALCLVACTKVSQLSPSADSISKNTVAKSASNTNNGGGVFNPMACTLPAPLAVTVTSPYTNTANGLQKLKIQWTHVGASSYKYIVRNMTTNAIVYADSVNTPIGFNNNYVFPPQTTLPIFSSFTTYQVVVASKCSDGSIGGNTTVQIIITGGPMVAVQDDLEKPVWPTSGIYNPNNNPNLYFSNCKKSMSKSVPGGATQNPSVSYQSCSYTTLAITGTGTGGGTGSPCSESVNNTNVTYVNAINNITGGIANIQKLKLTVPNAVTGDFLAISEIPNTFSLTNCISNISTNNTNNNWQLAKFLSNGAIAVQLDLSKKYRFRLYSSSMSLYYPKSGINQINLDCPNSN